MTKDINAQLILWLKQKNTAPIVTLDRYKLETNGCSKIITDVRKNSFVEIPNDVIVKFFNLSCFDSQLIILMKIINYLKESKYGMCTLQIDKNGNCNI